MGGRLGLELALNFLKPQYLFLESTAIGLETELAKELRQKSDLNLFQEESDNSNFLNKWYNNPMFDEFRRHESYHSNLKKKSGHNLLEWKESQKYLSQGQFPVLTNTIEKLSQTNIPIIYIYGEKDLKYAEIKKYFKQSFEILGAGHNPNKTHPYEITKILNVYFK